MTWMTKKLTEQLLKITIEALIEAYDTITDAPYPRAEQAEEPPGPHTAQPEADTHTDTPPPPADAPTLPQLQDALRTIAQTEGVEWIQEELFAGLGITNITQLPNDRLALAWEIITEHQEEISNTQ